MAEPDHESPPTQGMVGNYYRWAYRCRDCKYEGVHAPELGVFYGGEEPHNTAHMVESWTTTEEAKP